MAARSSAVAGLVTVSVVTAPGSISLMAFLSDMSRSALADMTPPMTSISDAVAIIDFLIRISFSP